MKELIYLASKINVDFAKVFEEKDVLGNNILMELAKNMKHKKTSKPHLSLVETPRLRS